MPESFQHSSANTHTIIDLMQANMLAYFRLFADLAGITLVDEDVFWVVSAGGEPGNQVLRTRLTSDSVDEQIDGILNQIGQSSNQIDWMVFPSCQPSDLGQRLAARGMIGGPGGTWMATTLPIQPTRSPSTRSELFWVERVHNLAALKVWSQVSRAGFEGDVSIHTQAYERHGFGTDAVALHYTGYLGETPVTSATLLLAGGIAGIWDVSTPNAMRGRGFGSAITQQLLHEAHQRGYQHAWVWSSMMGKRVYERVGFVASDFGVREYQWRKPEERRIDCAPLDSL